MGEILRPNFITTQEARRSLTDGSLALAEYSQPGIPNNVVLFEGRPKPPFQKPREVVASGGFSVEYSTVNEQAVYDDIVSYILEYRLRVGRFDYPLEFIQDNFGARIADPVTSESMRNKTKRAIWEKRARGEDSSREEADDKGMANLTDGIAIANVGDSIWWGSLPGRPEDGFAPYAFIYVGQVLRSIEMRNSITNEIEGVKKEIAMSAIRVENPSLLAFNQAYSELAGQNLDADSPEDFLINPVVVSGPTKDSLEREIRKKFKVNGGPGEKEWINGVIADLDPTIKDLVWLIKYGTMEERLDAFYSLEKHAVQLQKWRERGVVSSFAPKPTLNQLRATYQNVELENPSGSCPITNKSGNIFESNYAALNKALFGDADWDGETYDEAGPCRLCGRDVPCGPCKVCEVCTEVDNAKRAA